MGATLLAACGSSEPQTTPPPPAALVAQSRPIGPAPSFQPPVSGPVVGRCRRRLGQRTGTHVEVFAENRVVIIPRGIGTVAPRALSGGRITQARCYGSVVTLDPTGLILVARGSRPRLADLFRAWGQPLSPRRVASFSASAHRETLVYVGGRRWRGSPGAVPLTTHAEIVLEVGPRVPPHTSYAFPPGT